MYIPRSYRIDDRDAIAGFLTENPFGIVIANDADGRPLAVHTPCQFRERENILICDFHVARGNPIWRHAPHNPEVLAIFPGPHTYISPSWYREPNVPTWNYQAVHLYGACQVMSGEELASFLKEMVARYESGRPQARTWDTLDPEFRKQQMRGIVGLSVTVARIEAAAKMSQNRADPDFANIVHQLEQSDAPSDRAVGQVMRGVRPQLFDSPDD